VAGQLGYVYDFLAQQQVLHHLFGAIPQINWGYPPFALLPLLPLGWLPYFAALLVWTVCGLGLYLGSAAVTAKQDRFWFLAAAPAVAITLVTGQNGFFTAALMIGTLYLADRRPIAAGLILGLLSCKPQLGLLFPVALALSGRWRCFFAAAATFAALAAVSWGGFGPTLWTDYFREGLPFQYGVMTQGSGLLMPMVPTAFMHARALGASTAVAWAVQAPFSLLAAAAVIWTFARRRDPLLSQAVLVTAGFIFTPYIAVYDMVVLGWLIAKLRDRLTGLWDTRLMLAVWSLPALAIVFGLCRLPLAAPLMAAFLLRLLWHLKTAR
jgi:alpha-1,2-mannosyltransferase